MDLHKFQGLLLKRIIIFVIQTPKYHSVVTENIWKCTQRHKNIHWNISHLKKKVQKSFVTGCTKNK